MVPANARSAVTTATVATSMSANRTATSDPTDGLHEPGDVRAGDGEPDPEPDPDLFAVHPGEADPDRERHREDQAADETDAHHPHRFPPQAEEHEHPCGDGEPSPHFGAGPVVQVLVAGDEVLLGGDDGLHPGAEV